jgi:Zn-dependent protease
MLSWSLNLFRVRGIQLAVHFSFFLLLAYAAWEGWPNAGVHGALWNCATLLAFFTCIVLHELGHSFTAMRFGVGVRRILLMPIGGMAEFDSIPRQPSRELMITIAGPAVNFVIAGLLWLVVRGLPDEVPQYSLAMLVAQLFLANLIMGIFNLLPAFPMDGGRILRALLATRMPYLRATRWAAIIGKTVCILGVTAALDPGHLGLVKYAGLERGAAILPAILFTFIFVAGEMEYRAAERRERDDAHWREVLARIYGPQGPIDEPPVLSP